MLRSPLLRLALAGVVAASAASAAARQPAARTIVLDHARLIDGTGAAPIENGRIVIAGDRIREAGPADQCRVRAADDQAGMNLIATPFSQ